MWYVRILSRLKDEGQIWSTKTKIEVQKPLIENVVNVEWPSWIILIYRRGAVEQVAKWTLNKVEAAVGGP